MARSQNRKRQRADEPSRADIDPPAKKTKTRSEIELDAWASWEYPAEFWDRLSKISLSRRALKELDRRTRTRASSPTPSPANPSPSSRVFSRTTTSPKLARFARHGGPDLRDLRGYPHRPIDHQHPAAMSASRSSRSHRTRSTDPASTLPTSATTKTKKSTPYNRDFDLHLTEHLVHPVYSSQEPNLDEVMAAVAVPRPSLSPSKFSDSAFSAFRKNDARAKDEDDVLVNVIPTILGPSQADRFCARNTVFSNLEPLTDDTIAAPKPDIYYGAYPEQLGRPARNDLAGHIIPSTMEDKPMAPTFFMEVKGPDGKAAVATRQARYDGAVGSRAMHSLQNYGREEPQYDGKAYTYTSTYHNGQLQLFAHHVTAPKTSGGQPEYHMTKFRGFDMTDSRNTFAEGAGALRNTLDFAEQHRDSFIKAANARVQTSAETTENIESDLGDSTSDEFVDCEDRLTPQGRSSQGTAAVLALCNEDSAFPKYLYDDENGYDDDSQGPSQASAVAELVDPSMTYASSFTSSFTEQSRSKRQLSPRSGVTNAGTSKSRIRPSTRTAEAEDGPST